MLGLMISVSGTAILALGGGYEGAAPNEPHPARDSDILFQGHSLVDDFLWHAFRSWNAQAAVVADIAQSIIIGSPTNYFWDNSTGAKGVDSRAYLAAPGTDQYVYAEAGPVQALGGSALAPTYPLDYGNRFVQLAWANGARPLHYIIWPTTRTGTEPYQSTPGDWNGDQNPTMEWRAKLDFNRAHYEAIIGYVQARAPVGAKAFRAIPGDALMAALCDTAAAGNLIGVGSTRAEFYAAMFSDDIHLTNFGKYAVACLHFACIFKASPVGLSNVWLNEWDVAYSNMPSAEQAAQLQAIAWTVAQADDLGPFGALVPDDPYLGTGGGGTQWWAPDSNDFVIGAQPQTVTAMTIAMSFRFGAGDLNVSGSAPDLLFSRQFVRLQAAGGNDETGRDLACQLVATSWAQTDLTSLAASYMQVDETQNVVLIYDAAGLPGGNTAEVWVNGTLRLSTAAAIPNVEMDRLTMMSNAGQINATPNQGETQGWWVSFTTAIPAATMFSNAFDGANGLVDVSTIADVTPDVVQIGPPMQ